MTMLGPGLLLESAIGLAVGLKSASGPGVILALRLTLILGLESEFGFTIIGAKGSLVSVG